MKYNINDVLIAQTILSLYCDRYGSQKLCHSKAGIRVKFINITPELTPSLSTYGCLANL